MKVVYVAGPFRGEVKRNIKKAEAVSAQLAKAGVSFICPHSNSGPHDSLGLEDQYWLGMTMELLRRCDAVMLVAGWDQSSGSRSEVAEATWLRMKVFDPDQIKECIEWAKGKQ